MKHKIRDLLEERQRWQNLALQITPSVEEPDEDQTSILEGKDDKT